MSVKKLLTLKNIAKMRLTGKVDTDFDRKRNGIYMRGLANAKHVITRVQEEERRNSRESAMVQRSSTCYHSLTLRLEHGKQASKTPPATELRSNSSLSQLHETHSTIPGVT